MHMLAGQPGFSVHHHDRARRGQSGSDRAAIGLCGLAIVAIAAFLYPLIG